MNLLDWIVIAVFALLLIGIIVWVLRQKQNSSGDYFLAGRDATWIAIGASIFASNIGSEHLIGLGRSGRFKRNGNGTLGNSGMDDTGFGLGFCAFLLKKYGNNHARIFRAPLQ
jgi:hypothetical protein